MADKKVVVDHHKRIHLIVDVYRAVVHEQCGTPLLDVKVGPIVLNLRDTDLNWDYTIGELGTLNKSGLFVIKPVMQFPGGGYMLDHFTTALSDANIPWHHGL